LQRQIFGRAGAHRVVELAQAMHLLDDWLLLITPDNLVLSQRREKKDQRAGQGKNCG
jgi:hypothetical protein